MLTDKKKLFMTTELGGQIVILRNKMMAICMYVYNRFEIKGGNNDTRTSSDESNDGYLTSVSLLVYEFYFKILKFLLHWINIINNVALHITTFFYF